MPLLEKAYAKVHGGYHQLRGGSVAEALIDLTGSPTASYDLSADYLRKLITGGQFWRLLEHYRSKNYIVVFETEPVGRWATVESLQKSEKEEREQLKRKGNFKDLYELK